MSTEEIDAPLLETLRLTLEPLRADHAEEMVSVLADERLYAFTGDGPPGLAELRERYRRQAAGRSPDGVDRWLNWIVRRAKDGVAVGFVQATLNGDPPSPAPVTAVLAWTTGAPFQGHGYAREAAAAVVASLRAAGVARCVAYIHPENVPSMGVARALGMAPTEESVDGEVVWECITAARTSARPPSPR
ncbi:MAG TPA: GNAT family N-acetyltransferase [Solirubrobacteraceae bacterium]|jgi:RimJ/RimL family protein N-acetyltransferase